MSKNKEMVLFNYSTKHLKNKDKVRFYYALKGRDGKSGIIKSSRTLYIGKTVLLTPIEFEDELKQFFQVWKLPFTSRRLIITKEETIKHYKNEE